MVHRILSSPGIPPLAQGPLGLQLVISAAYSEVRVVLDFNFALGGNQAQLAKFVFLRKQFEVETGSELCDGLHEFSLRDCFYEWLMCNSVELTLELVLLPRVAMAFGNQTQLQS